MISYEIEAFGRRIGLDHLALDDQGRAQLNISGVGSFHLELSDAGPARQLLMYLCLPFDAKDAARLSRLFKLCDYRRNLPVPVSAGVFKGKAIIMSRMDESLVTAAGIENTLRFLAGCMPA
ncbi:MAG: hypothetical protein J6I40_06700 [Mailhella sp.]|nr:hypothetical protein [Mailhella sp.]